MWSAIIGQMSARDMAVHMNNIWTCIYRCVDMDNNVEYQAMWSNLAVQAYWRSYTYKPQMHDDESSEMESVEEFESSVDDK